MMKYLMVLLSLFSGSVLGMGRVNELCGIDSVKTIEIINLPSYVTTLVFRLARKVLMKYTDIKWW